ncbi:hypothetical protein BDY19DRAFT_1059275 [Irpex rosettiformis]|uniref:Uncharacterized protein n=1 Tax=Irpex rosettiformis TaxID=378272 RepID=A0ACB8TVA9_9APHY|nr:hypothetical protein BDY19DRAFT_1059275 [Irpex rosettiformis]
MTGERNPFTDKEESYLIQYIAKYCPENKNRSGNKLYETLVENRQKLWPWSAAHSASGWRERYVRNKERFDRRIGKWQAKSLSQEPTSTAPTSSFAPLPSQATTSAGTPRRSGSERQPFTPKEEELLVQYLAIETRDGFHRKGNTVYQRLVSMPEQWPWGSAHTAQSWLERYRRRSEEFDARIRAYQDQNGIKRTGTVDHELWNRLPSLHPLVQGDEKTAQEPRRTLRKSRKRPAVREEEEEEAEDGGIRHKRQRLERLSIVAEREEGEEEEAQRRKHRRQEKQKMVVEDQDQDQDQEELHENGDGRRKHRREETQKTVGEEEEEEEGTPTPQGHRRVARPSIPQQDGPQVPSTNGQNKPSRAVSEVGTGTSGQDAVDAEALLDEVPDSQAEGVDYSPSRSQEPVEAIDDDLYHPALEVNMEVGTQRIDMTPRTSGSANIHATTTQESYIVRSLEVPQKPVGKGKLPQVSQEPTPPTSDAPLSPLPSPTKPINPESTRRVALPSNKPSAAPQESPIRPVRTIHDDIAEEEDDRFESAVPAAQSSVPRRPGARQPPVRIEGAFNSALSRPGGAKSYKGTRRVTGVEDTSESEPEQEPHAVWPPKRGKGKAVARPVATAEKPATTGSKASAKPFVIQDTEARSHTDLSKNSTESATSRPLKQTRSVPRRSLSRASLTKPSKSTANGGTTSRIRGRPSLNTPQPEAGPSRLEPSITDTAERRHTLATPAPHRLVQRLKGKARHSMPAYAHRPLETDSIVSNVSFNGRIITAEDHKYLIESGMRNILQQLATNTGFGYEVVENVWGFCGTIADTKAMLDRMCVNATKGANDAYEELGIEDKVQERERSVLQGQLVSPVELSTSAGVSKAFMTVARVEAAVEDEYWPPDNSKAAILLRQQMKQQEEEEEEEEEEEAAEGLLLEEEQGEDEVEEEGEDEDEDEDVEEGKREYEGEAERLGVDKEANSQNDEEENDSRYDQVQRILGLVMKNFKR